MILIHPAALLSIISWTFGSNFLSRELLYENNIPQRQPLQRPQQSKNIQEGTLKICSAFPLDPLP